MKSADVRRKFIEFFEHRGHRAIPSSSLIPHGDPTLLFTNAGMNQFKNVFLGLEPRDYSRAVTCQKCVRAGGKHNDLENVGKTERHHTFFEMLGNFSFGDYFKNDAIPWSWELVTGEYKMDPQRLWITIHHSDDDAFEIWNKKVGVSSDRIVRLGDKDNFWSMGDTGPCGPCSEIYYDRGEAYGCDRPECNIECDCGRYTEFWNLVFMQYNRNESGELIPLPRPSIDTGLGLERTTALLQGVSSNYETDLLFPIIEAATKLSGVSWKQSDATDVALKVLADHSRAATFLISEGITPSNEGRGYVLRRIIRRALRYGRVLHFQDAFLYKLTAQVIDIMKVAYPELEDSRSFVAEVCQSEEQKFKQVVENATEQLERIFAEAQEQKRKNLSGHEVFKLYDTFGMPVDFVQEMANERDFTLDLGGFEEEMEKQKKAARAAWKGDVAFESQEMYRNLGQQFQSVFTGYSTTVEAECEIVQILIDFRPVLKISEGENAEIILNKTCFYAESGGQIGDRGYLQSNTGRARVIDTQTPVPGLIIHKVLVESGYIELGSFVNGVVDPVFRNSVRKNHTATHILHAALRTYLGMHVKQAGSLVAPDRLRFDFTHYTGLKADEVREMELLVNEKVLSNNLVETKVTTVEDAMAAGAMALFGEKYGERVRMVTIGDFSKELCGGTHCSTTGEVGAFLIARQSSTAAGIRRVEALTGKGALEYVQQERKLMENLTNALKIPRDDLLQRIQELIDRNKKLEKELEKLKAQSMLQPSSADQFVRTGELPDGKKFYVRMFQEADADQIGNYVDEVSRKGEFALVVAGATSTGNIAVRSSGGPDAHQFMRAVLAPYFGGGGGGRSDFAKGGLKKLKDMSPQDALQAVFELTSKTP